MLGAVCSGGTTLSHLQTVPGPLLAGWALPQDREMLLRAGGGEWTAGGGWVRVGHTGHSEMLDV